MFNQCSEYAMFVLKIRSLNCVDKLLGLCGEMVNALSKVCYNIKKLHVCLQFEFRVSL